MKDPSILKSIQIVSIHLQVSTEEKHISKPINKALEEYPKRTQTHVKRLTKKGFHIQNAIN